MLSLIQIFIVLYFSAFILSSCVFPDFVQTLVLNSRRRQWRSHVTNDKGIFRAITFHIDVMRVDLTSYGDSLKYITKTGDLVSYTRTCVNQNDSNKFIVSHRNDNEVLFQFMCLRFIKRGHSVVQLEQSSLSSTNNKSLCRDDSLRLNDWPLIDIAASVNRDSLCPLRGGFNLKIYDRQNNVGVCNAHNGEIRLESECSRNDGLIFRFRYPECVPRGLHMRTTQHLLCMERWIEDNSEFVVLKSYKTSRYWCLRIPHTHELVFRGYLFRDLYCSLRQFNDTIDYLMLDFIADDELANLSDPLCYDDYAVCSYWSQPCVYPFMLLTCARRCNICSPNVRPSRCILPPHIRSTWVAEKGSIKDTIQINNSSIFSHYYDETLVCVRWETTDSKQEQQLWEKLFVRIFHNGCRPQYVCIQFMQHSPSVLWLRQSQRELWPFGGAAEAAVHCELFKYRNDEYIVEHLYRGIEFVPLIAIRAYRQYVRCCLEDTLLLKRVMEQPDKNCLCELTQKNLIFPHKMKLYCQDCMTYKTYSNEYSCLEASTNQTSAYRLIVVEAQDLTIGCWFFQHYS